MHALVVDDDPTTRTQLRALLGSWGYDVLEAGDAAQAESALARRDAPLLMIVDWVMPETNGVELLRRARSLPEASPLYVIMVSGKHESAAAAYALESGADDFVSKPLDPVALRARVGVGARMLAKSEALQRYAEEMSRLAEARAAEILHADRLATLGQLAAGVAHEINNPTTFIAGNAELLERVWPDLERALAQAGDARLVAISAEVPAMLAAVRGGAERVRRIVADLKSYARKGSSDPRERELANVNESVERAARLLGSRFKHDVRLELDLGDISACRIDPPTFEQALVNLLNNACDAVQGVAGATVAVRSRQRDDGIEVVVEDNGAGIPDAVMREIWNPFFTTKPPGKGTGLGLCISQRIIAEHGGALRASNRREGGARFVISGVGS
ncbi:MAG: response regulator [Myxococcales bacterium]|nr:response regulator [Myxococcales bacterium]